MGQGEQLMSLGNFLVPNRRLFNLIVVAVIFTSGSFLIFLNRPNLSQEQVLVQRLAELQARLQHLDLMHRARQEEVHVLSQQLGQLLAASDADDRPLVATELGAHLRDLREQAALSSRNGSSTAGQPLRPPTVYDFLPHLMGDPLSLRPAFALSSGRSGVSVVMGMPTVKRGALSYLLTTLHSLLENISPEEAADSLIVVFVAEVEKDYVRQVAEQIEDRFRDEVESGLIEVISPPESYYPDLDNLPRTLGDPPGRVRWRTKQNLDFAFLMMYAQPKGTYYVQLEDDILAKKNFISTMKNYALQKTAEKSPWFVLQFCQLGFIGKMFKCSDLPWLIDFFLMFYNDKPVDWLLDHLIQSKVCRNDKDVKHCREAKSKLWVSYNTSLFQHVGLHSSLKGKVQKLQDKKFGKVALFRPHSNPKAEVCSDIKIYQNFTLEGAYLGKNFFWGLQPKTGDHVTFTFESPVRLERFLFRSGNLDHIADCFYNTTVEVLPDSGQTSANKSQLVTSDGFFVVGEFDSLGVAEGSVDAELNPVKAVRLNVHSESENWVILSEISMEVSGNR